MYITVPDEEPFGFAGLWEYWDDKGKADEAVLSCTILTTDASSSIREIHHRMPVILKPEAYRDLMQTDASPDDLKDIISTQIDTDFAHHPVSKTINSVRNNSAELIEAA